MFLKGLHLEDIKQILVTGALPQAATDGQATATSAPVSTTANYPPAAIQSWTPPSNATIRIASFNIQIFGDKKASNPNVMAEIGRVISSFDIVAIQEIRTQDDLFIPKFVELLNQYSGRSYACKVSPRLGNTTSTEQYAFIYDTAKLLIHPQFTFVVGDPDNLLHREPHVGFFTVRGVDPSQRFTFMLVNIHTDPDVAKDEMDALAQVYNVLRRQPIPPNNATEDDIILLGDFNTNVPCSPNSSTGNTGRALTREDLAGLGQLPGIYPVIQNQPTNTVHSKLHDNVLFCLPSTSEFVRGGVYDLQTQHGLTVDQAKLVSDHLPVWAEFSIYEAGSPNQVATGSTAPTR